MSLNKNSDEDDDDHSLKMRSGQTGDKDLLLAHSSVSSYSDYVYYTVTLTAVADMWQMLLLENWTLRVLGNLTLVVSKMLEATNSSTIAIVVRDALLQTFDEEQAVAITEENATISCSSVNADLAYLSGSLRYDEMVGPEEGRSLTPDSNTERRGFSFQQLPPGELDYGDQTKAGTSTGLTVGSQRALSRMSARRPPVLHSSDNSEDDDEDEDDELDVQVAAVEGYTPQNMELEFKLRPFIPDFIPAVGDIDAFLKIPPPDDRPDQAGLQVLDEPCARQSDPHVLHLQLRAVAKQSSAKTVSSLTPYDSSTNSKHSLSLSLYLQVIKKVESAEKNPKAIDRWIKDISDLHRSKPPPTVHYTRSMPDIDGLMQEWPSDLEQQLREVGLPTDDLDCDLPSFVDIVCNLFDIPTYESRIQSLHVLFTLYSAVKTSQHATGT
uniref:Intraflagellar transport protein 46 homolog n=1 Tax=Timema cristinae TaxID=61476 RepID=A0A7R9H3V5_TIMCR|nr:unnamed protein product [Timema cristinae]